MPYVITQPCIGTKDASCVEVCPVDCIYEGEDQYYIHPDECIDCGACEPECPVNAILPDTEEGTDKWVEFNAKYSVTWPNISVKIDAPADAKEWEGKPEKMQYFSEKPGEGT